ncbi:MAG: hypothetical protein EXS31_13860 [Pedosphaera sp.]|nr:hypothetical protein [Pedosphaera sp.]
MNGASINTIPAARLAPPLFFTFLLLRVAIQAIADEPSVSYIFPAGGQRGTRVEFKVGGHYLHGEAAFEMLGQGVTSSSRIYRTNTVWFEGPLIPLPASQQAEDYPKDYAGMVTIAPDATPGPRSWRVSNSQGVTAARPFVVGDLPEIIEREVEGRPIPVQVELPITINGRIFPREDVDIWTFAARAGEEITCDVQAGRIGSPLEARLELLDPEGRRMMEAMAGAAGDPQLSFEAPKDGLYQLRIHDINFGGLQHYLYRLTITREPVVRSVFPLGGRRGTRISFALTGTALPARTASLGMPANASSVFPARFPFENRLANAISIEVDDLPEHLESEPNQELSPHGAVEVPAVLNGRIDPPGDVDLWAFKAGKDQVLDLDLRARRLGSPLNSVLALLNASGKELVQNDDLNGDETDSYLTFKVPADGVYFARVQERYAGRGGPRFGYRLRITPPTPPDFTVKLAANAVTVVREVAGLTEEPKKMRPPPKPAQLRIEAERIGGFTGEIEITIEGLPKGVTVKGNKIAANQGRTELVFTASPESTVAVSRLRIHGRAKLGEAPVKRTAMWPGDAGQAALEEVALAVAIPTPYRVYADYLLAYGLRGSTFHRRYLLDRGGMTGPMTACLADRQFRHLQGVTGPTLTIPPEASEFEYPIILAPWMEIGRTSRSVVMVSGLVKDHDGSEHWVSFSSGEQNEQIIVVVAEGQMRVEAERRSILAEPDGRAQLKVHVHRDKSILSKELTFELVLPAHFRGVSASPVTIPAGGTEAMLAFQFAKNRGPFNMPATLRATTVDPHDPHVAEITVEFVTPE